MSASTPRSASDASSRGEAFVCLVGWLVHWYCAFHTEFDTPPTVPLNFARSNYAPSAASSSRPNTTSSRRAARGPYARRGAPSPNAAFDTSAPSQGRTLRQVQTPSLPSPESIRLQEGVSAAQLVDDVKSIKAAYPQVSFDKYHLKERANGRAAIPKQLQKATFMLKKLQNRFDEYTDLAAVDRTFEGLIMEWKEVHKQGGATLVNDLNDLDLNDLDDLDLNEDYEYNDNNKDNDNDMALGNLMDKW